MGSSTNIYTRTSVRIKVWCRWRETPTVLFTNRMKKAGAVIYLKCKHYFLCKCQFCCSRFYTLHIHCTAALLHRQVQGITQACYLREFRIFKCSPLCIIKVAAVHQNVFCFATCPPGQRPSFHAICLTIPCFLA